MTRESPQSLRAAGAGPDPGWPTGPRPQSRTPGTGGAASLRRMYAIYRRHAYVLRHSPAELFEVVYWSVLDLLLWGLLAAFLAHHDTALPVPIAFLVGAAILWSLLWRTQIGIAVAVLHEAWSRHLASLLASPVRPIEYVAGACAWSLTQAAASWGILVGLAWALFEFRIWDLGLPLVAFAGALILFGVALAMLAIGIVLRAGHEANVLAWGLAGILMPLSAVYYPVAVLPGWVQPVALALPLAHVFEGMREVLAGGPTPWGSLWTALVLDVVYLAAAVGFAAATFRSFRRRGSITRYM